MSILLFDFYLTLLGFERNVNNEIFYSMSPKSAVWFS